MIPKKIVRLLDRLPSNVQEKFRNLAEDLRDQGPIQREWNNFSNLGTKGAKTKFHCHLSYSYVACWEHEKGTTLIEVYYVGSREGAPY